MASVTEPPLVPSGEEVAVVEMQVRLDANFDAVSGAVLEFGDTFRKGMAEALQIEAERLELVRLSRGSVIVDFRIVDPPVATPATPASEAADRLEKLLVGGLYSYFPQDIQAYMRGATVERRSSLRVAAQGSALPTALATVVPGFAPPANCSCVSAEGEGVRAACARHLGLAVPWCKVDASCGVAKKGSGVQSHWVLCAADGDAPPAEEAGEQKGPWIREASSSSVADRLHSGGLTIAVAACAFRVA